jgi:hypothetical protein
MAGGRLLSKRWAILVTSIGLAAVLFACGSESRVGRVLDGTGDSTPAASPTVSLSAVPTPPAPVVTASPRPSNSPAPRTSPKPSSSPKPSPSATPSPLPLSGSGVRGRVTAGPTCPVEREDQPCPPQPVSAEIEARDEGGHVAGKTHSREDGRYAMSLSPGHYTLVVVTGSQFPYCPDTPVEVRRGEVTTADIDCDTGIR